MSYISLAEIHRRSIDYPGPSSRMASLDVARKAMENQLSFIKDQGESQLRAKLKKFSHEMAEDDITYEKYKIKSEVEELFPKLFRGGFLISLWSVFEACIKDIAEYVRQQKDFPFNLQDIRSGDFLDQTYKFFFKLLAVDPFPDTHVKKKLRELKEFRNVFAHHNGSTEQLPDALRSETEEGYRRKGILIHSDLHHQYAAPTKEYVEDALNTIKDFLESFSESIYCAIHPTKLEDNF